MNGGRYEEAGVIGCTDLAGNIGCAVLL